MAWKKRLLIVTACALAGMVVGGLLGFASGKIIPDFFRHLLCSDSEPVALATFLGATSGAVFVGGMGCFGLLTGRLTLIPWLCSLSPFLVALMFIGVAITFPCFPRPEGMIPYHDPAYVDPLWRVSEIIFFLTLFGATSAWLLSFIIPRMRPSFNCAVKQFILQLIGWGSVFVAAYIAAASYDSIFG